MSPQPSHLPQDRSAYIPPRVQQEMAKHMQQTLPANLQYYQKSGAYVPPNVQKQMAQHMQQSMPEHLKQYINPYMQQQVVPQHLASAPGVVHPTSFTPHPSPSPSFTPNQQPLRPFEPQPAAAPAPQPLQPQVPTPQPAAGPQVVSSPPQPYAFITNPENPVKPSTLLTRLNGKSLRTRVIILGGGLVALLIVLNILKGLVIAGFDLPPFVSVLQDQQELIHLTSTSAPSASSETTLATTYQNFITTTQVTVASAQSQLLTYLIDNNQKVSTKALSLKVSPSIDTQLTNSVTSGNYATTFQNVMSSQLKTYMADLHAAYVQTSGKKGHEQLNNDYRQAALLTKQLNEAGSAPTD